MYRRLSLSLALATTLFALPAAAQVVSSFDGASGPGLASMSFNNIYTPSPGNDDVAGASDNWMAVHQKDYDVVDYIDMVFSVDDVGMPTSEYIFTEGVNNGTGVNWTDYHLELGFGVGGDFVISPPGDGLDFDAPDENSPYDFPPFATVVVGEDTIDCYDGIVAPGGFYNFGFPIDVPSTISTFTIRQWPTISPVATEASSFGRVKALY